MKPSPAPRYGRPGDQHAKTLPGSNPVDHQKAPKPTTHDIVHHKPADPRPALLHKPRRCTNHLTLRRAGHDNVDLDDNPFDGIVAGNPAKPIFTRR